MSNLFVSLFLAAFMSFAVPVTLIGCAIAFFNIISYIPGFWELGQQMTSHIRELLAIFGSGKPIQGLITLGATASFVGILLDILNFYRYQSIRDQDINNIDC